MGPRTEPVHVGRHDEGVALQAGQGRGRPAEGHDDLVGRESVRPVGLGARTGRCPTLNVRVAWVASIVAVIRTVETPSTSTPVGQDEAHASAPRWPARR